MIVNQLVWSLNPALDGYPNLFEAASQLALQLFQPLLLHFAVTPHTQTRSD